MTCAKRRMLFTMILNRSRDQRSRGALGDRSDKTREGVEKCAKHHAGWNHERARDLSSAAFRLLSIAKSRDLASRSENQLISFRCRNYEGPTRPNQSRSSSFFIGVPASVEKESQKSSAHARALLRASLFYYRDTRSYISFAHPIYSLLHACVCVCVCNRSKHGY